MNPPLVVSLILAAAALGFASAWMWQARFRRSGGFASEAALAAFDTVLILIDGARAELVAGSEALAACAAALGASEASPGALIQALAAADPGHGRRLEALRSRGEALAFEVQVQQGVVVVQGRSSGALAWLKVSTVPAAAESLPAASRLAAFIDARPEPAWMADATGLPIWANRSWISAVGVRNLAAARAARASLDREGQELTQSVAAAGETRETVRWIVLGGERRALLIRAWPLEGGGVGVWTDDVTATRAASDQVERQRLAHEQILNQIGDAVVVFGSDRRLVYHNAAFASLWDLEPAWLADRPSHGEMLDRLRQRRRLPETMDYTRFKADELARYEELAPSPEAIWRLPDERTLRVVGQPHPMGGILMLFSDITPELRLKTQFNHLIQVQQATLDKLTDAVAVFGADGRLKLHNEAFEQFWSVTSGQLAQSPDYDGVVDLCLRRLHDQRFWRDLKGRITDPDPLARAPMQGELVTADKRIVAHQSRPLPDGATLISFADVTDTRRLEGALLDREAALSEAVRLKRLFVGSVSYELRTPLTTILGYAELLERDTGSLGERALGHVGAVRSAAAQLARSVNQVLDMAEIDAGEMILEVEDVDIAELIVASRDRWRKEARAGLVSLDGSDSSAAGRLRGDGRRLGEVLDHLVENALRFTTAGGEIRLSAERGTGEVRLLVSDTGRGIPFHVQAHIFDRFSGQDQGGAGLGLALVKALVELHGGWVSLESEPGAGATFTCHLPESAEPPEGRPELF
jgi:hypothetical protein